MTGVFSLAKEPSKTAYDVVIVGGAMFGASVAWFLVSNPDFDGRVLVVERDPTYEFASTSHTNSCMRQQFSQAINVQVSQFAAKYVKNFRAFMDDDPRVPDVPLHADGYLYLADTDKFAATLRENQKIQAGLGAGTRHMSAADIAAAWPFFRADDIIAANHNPVDEGYFAGSTLFDWWKRMGAEQGVEYIHNKVVAMTLNRAGKAVNCVTLQSGEVITCGTVVNAAGPRAAPTARMAGIDLPVEPRKRYSYVFAASRPLANPLPLTIDPGGVHMRAEGNYYLAGCTPDIDPAVEPDDFKADHSLWEGKVWPAIANRIPQFDALKLINTWVGHYAFNTFDQNAILGRHTTVENFIFVNGFSGHGFQQSPAMGRGTAELITYGHYRSLDLTPFAFDRIPANRPFVESAVI